MAMSGHESARANTVVWLTPPEITEALGGWQSFDLDPCAAPEPRPFRTAKQMNAHADGDGLEMPWSGRVWMNPPYTSAEIKKWLKKLALHGDGIALIFARTETDAFQRYCWPCASAMLFLSGRLHFYTAEGVRASANAGAPSVLIAYGSRNAEVLRNCGLAGAFVDCVQMTERF
jgi:hypothetical protein